MNRTPGPDACFLAKIGRTHLDFLSDADCQSFRPRLLQCVSSVQKKRPVARAGPANRNYAGTRRGRSRAVGAALTGGELLAKSLTGLFSVHGFFFGGRSNRNRLVSGIIGFLSYLYPVPDLYDVGNVHGHILVVEIE